MFSTHGLDLQLCILSPFTPPSDLGKPCSGPLTRPQPQAAGEVRPLAPFLSAPSWSLKGEGTSHLERLPRPQVPIPSARRENGSCPEKCNWLLFPSPPAHCNSLQLTTRGPSVGPSGLHSHQTCIERGGRSMWHGFCMAVAFIGLHQWFSDGDSFAPHAYQQGTFSNVWRYFWLSQRDEG